MTQDTFDRIREAILEAMSEDEPSSAKKPDELIRSAAKATKEERSIVCSVLVQLLNQRELIVNEEFQVRLPEGSSEENRVPIPA